MMRFWIMLAFFSLTLPSMYTHASEAHDALEQGLKSVYEGNHAQAFEIWEKVLDQEPADAAILFNYSLLAHANGLRGEALYWITQYLERIPWDWQALILARSIKHGIQDIDLPWWFMVSYWISMPWFFLGLLLTSWIIVEIVMALWPVVPRAKKGRAARLVTWLIILLFYTSGIAHRYQRDWVWLVESHPMYRYYLDPRPAGEISEGSLVRVHQSHRDEKNQQWIQVELSSGDRVWLPEKRTRSWP